MSSSLGDCNCPQTNLSPKGITQSASPAALRAPAPLSLDVRIRSVIAPTRSSTPLRLHQHRIPAPETIVGQPRTAPPAIDRVVAAEVFLVSDNGLAEFGERQPASLVCLEAISQVLFADDTQLV